jgi:PKD repeat protein
MNLMLRLRLITTCLTLIILTSSYAMAQWKGNPRIHAPIGNSMHVVSDSAGGFFVAGITTDGVVQRINPEGKVLWSTSMPMNSVKALAADNTGGVFVLLFGYSGTKYYYFLHHLDKDGNFVWSRDSSRKVFGTPYDRAVVTSDLSGGCWASAGQVYGTGSVTIRHVSGDGTVSWPNKPNGIVIDGRSPYCSYGALVARPNREAWIVWRDGRERNQILLAQRIASDGTLLFADTGKPVCTRRAAEGFVFGVPGPDGGIYVVWGDVDENGHSAVRGTRLDSNGFNWWADCGTVLMRDTFPTHNGLVMDHDMDVLPDGEDGFILFWAAHDLHPRLMRVDLLGNFRWPGKEIEFPIYLHNDGPHAAMMVTGDGAGGVITVWRTLGATRDTIDYGMQFHATHIDHEGRFKWPADGIDVLSVDTTDDWWADSYFGWAMTPDMNGGAYLAWTSRLLPGNNKYQSYCHRLFDDGRLANESPKAGFTASSTDVCVGDTVIFSNTTLNGAAFTWSFGDNTPDISLNHATHGFAQPGHYTVRLTASNAIGHDEVSLPIVVHEPPSPSFTVSSTTPLAYRSVHFSNTTAKADAYVWDFGDGGGSTERNPVHTYKRADTFTVTLTATNGSGCHRSATMVLYVQPTIRGRAEAATPNGTIFRDPIELLEFDRFTNRFIVVDTVRMNGGSDGSKWTYEFSTDRPMVYIRAGMLNRGYYDAITYYPGVLTFDSALAIRTDGDTTVRCDFRMVQSFDPHSCSSNYRGYLYNVCGEPIARAHLVMIDSARPRVIADLTTDINGKWRFGNLCNVTTKTRFRIVVDLPGTQNDVIYRSIDTLEHIYYFRQWSDTHIARCYRG